VQTPALHKRQCPAPCFGKNLARSDYHAAQPPGLPSFWLAIFPINLKDYIMSNPYSEPNPLALDVDNSIISLSHILIQLDMKGALDPAMQQVIRHHSRTLIDTIPPMIQSAAQVLGNGFVEGSKSEQLGWAISLLSDT
jgi:hypothetical protein